MAAPRATDQTMSSQVAVRMVLREYLGKRVNRKSPSVLIMPRVSVGETIGHVSFRKPNRLRHEETLEAVRWQPCVACGFGPPCDPAHVRSVGSGGPDTSWNVMPLCRYHHTEQHAKGWGAVAARHPTIKIWLEGMGWELRPRLWHPDLEEH